MCVWGGGGGEGGMRKASWTVGYQAGQVDFFLCCHFQTHVALCLVKA